MTETNHSLDGRSMDAYAVGRFAEGAMAAVDDDGGIRVPIGSSLAEAERWLIEATLAHWSGNKNRAARTLGCSLKTLYNKLAAYERQGVEAHA